MTSITSPVPEIGVATASEQVDTTNILTEIKNALNGNLGLDNLTSAARNATHPPVVTPLPGSPVDDDRILFRAAEGVVWPFRYNAGSVSPYKWEALGGPTSIVSSTFSAGTPAGNTTLGSLTVPLDGEYIVSAMAQIHEADPDGRVNLNIAGTLVVDQRKGTSGANIVSFPTPVTLTAGPLSMVIGRASAGSVYSSRFSISPRRVG